MERQERSICKVPWCDVAPRLVATSWKEERRRCFGVVAATVPVYVCVFVCVCTGPDIRQRAFSVREKELLPLF